MQLDWVRVILSLDDAIEAARNRQRHYQGQRGSNNVTISEGIYALKATRESYIAGLDVDQLSRLERHRLNKQSENPTNIKLKVMQKDTKEEKLFRRMQNWIKGKPFRDEQC